MKKIEAYTMATRKPCETALKQQEHKAFACDFKRADRTNTDTLEYIASTTSKSQFREVIEVDKNIIYEYMDAKALVKETEEDIRRHRRKTFVQDKVTGSNPEFPYQPQSFNISGCVENTVNIDEEERLLEERKLNAKQIKVKAERVINKAPVRMQRIIRFKVMQGLTWDEVAAKMKGNCTGESARKEFQRWMKEK